MKYIRRSILSEIEGSSQKQKAVAFALLLKDKTNDSSCIKNFTIYKLQKLTQDKNGKNGMAYKTIRKYLNVLFKMDLAVVMDGKLFIKKMSSSSKHRNINIGNFTLDRTKNIFEQIRELQFLIIQAHKDFIKGLLRLRDNPQKGVDHKKVRRICKKRLNNPYCEYKEHGLSYSKIAKNIGCCARTAYTVVKNAITRGWVTKTNNCKKVRLENVWYKDIPGYSFTTRHLGIVLRANTYSLSPEWAESLVSLPVPSQSLRSLPRANAHDFMV